MRNTFTFNGIASSEYGVYISGAKTFGAPARRYEALVIPGRDGDLILDNRSFEPVPHVYNAFIKSSFDANIQGLRNYLMSIPGRVRLSDTYHPDEFYLAYYNKGLEPEVLANLRAGSFELEFTRDPRRFLTTGEAVQTFTSSGSISNPSLFASKPLLRVYGTGEFTVGTGTMTITAADSYTDLDCEIQDAFKGTASRNLFITGDFPTLAPGANTVTLGTGITKIEITPRWYIL